jgi:hypothetical protein
VHRFDGQNAVVYSIGSPFRFDGLPLADCGDGFDWCAADDSLRYWLADGLTFDVWEHGRWSPIRARTVEASVGRASFDRCLRGLSVRAVGMALPTSEIATSEQWQLAQEVLVNKDPAALRVTAGQARARLTGLRESTWDGLAVVGRVLTVLPSATAGAFVGLGELVRDAVGVTVLFDEQGVSYAPR